MYHNPHEYSNQRMAYSFATGQPQQQQYPAYTQVIEPVNSRHLYEHTHVPQPNRVIQPPHPKSQSKAEGKIKKDLKNLEEDYQKLFVGGQLSDVSSHQRPKLIQTRNVSIENRYHQEIMNLKDQYQKKLDYLQEQNQQNQKIIKMQYQEYLDKLRSENVQLISINKQYENEIKQLLQQIQTINISDINVLIHQNSRLKQRIQQFQEERNAYFNQPKIIINETKTLDNKDKQKEHIQYLQIQLENATRIIESKQKQILALNKAPKQNDFLFQIERYKEIINQKNNQIGNIKSLNATLERRVMSFEQTINELSSYKEKYLQAHRQKQQLIEIETQLKRAFNDKQKDIEIYNVEKMHLQKKEEHLASKLSSLELRHKAVQAELREAKAQLDMERRKKKEKQPTKEYEQYIAEISETVKDFKSKMNQSQMIQISQKQIYQKQQQALEAKFSELTSILQWKQKQLSQLSSNLNQCHTDLSQQALKVKQYQETISSLKQQLQNKNMMHQNKRNQYERNLVKYKSEAESIYNKNIQQFKEKVSRLELQLQGRKSPKKVGRSDVHIRSPHKSKRESRRQSRGTLTSAQDRRLQQFQEKINQFLKYNKDQQVYQLLQQAKLQLRYQQSQNYQLSKQIKILQGSKDISNKSMIAEDKIRLGEARLGYINQKNQQLEQRIDILIAVNNELKAHSQQSALKIQQINKKYSQVQQKLQKSQESVRQIVDRNKQQYEKLFQLHTVNTSKIPLLQKTIGDLNREIEDKNSIIRQLNNKKQNQSITIENKSSYFFNKINILNKQLEDSQRSSEQLKAKCWKTERDLNQSLAENQLLQEELKSKQTELKIISTKHSEISIQANLRSEELAAQRLQLVALRNTNQLLNQRLKNFASQQQYKQEVNTKQILNLHTQLEQSALTLNSFKQHRQSSEQTIKDTKNQISKLNNQITQLKLKLDNNQRQYLQNRPIVRVESKGSSQGTRNSILLQQKLTRANTQISALTNKILSYQLQINRIKQSYNQLQGKMMIVNQQLQSQCAQKNQLQLEIGKVSEQMLSNSRKQDFSLRRTQSDTVRQVVELQRRLKIVNEQKQALMRELKQHVTQTHNQTSQTHDRFNAFLKQQLQASQLEIQKFSQSVSSLQVLNEHYYTLLQSIPTRYSYYFNFMKKINIQFRDLVGELDLQSSRKNTEISNKLLSNISQSLQIFDQIRQLQQQVQSRIAQLESLKNG